MCFFYSRTDSDIILLDLFVPHEISFGFIDTHLVGKSLVEAGVRSNAHPTLISSLVDISKPFHNLFIFACDVLREERFSRLSVGTLSG